MTGRAWLLIGLVFALALAGLAGRSGAVLALALPLLVYLAAGLAVSPEAVQLQVERSMVSDQVFSGKPAALQVRVINLGQPLKEVWLEEVIEPRLTPISGAAHSRLEMVNGQAAQLAYQLAGPRGEVNLRGVRYLASDPFDLFRKGGLLEVPARLLILPEPARLHRLPIHPRQTQGFSGPIPARRAGSGVDFFGVREYHLGDAQRRINWRASARHPRSLFTNEFEQEQVADVGLILDARQVTDVCLANTPLFEHTVFAAASLAQAFLSDGHRVSLLVYGYVMARVYPGYGKHQRERILRTLARARTGDKTDLESLNYLPTRLFPAGAQLVMISPLAEGDFPALARLRSLGYDLLLVSPDPVAYELHNLEQTPDVLRAARLARLERALLLNKCRRVGIWVVNWNVLQPLDGALQTATARQAAGRPMALVKAAAGER